MKKVYLDNAATTAVRPEVVTEMAQVLTGVYGNPSSVHSIGRSAKVVLENSRKAIAKHLNAEAREIIFTSGGTEGNNLIITGAVKKHKLKRIITSRTEHHAVLHCITAIQSEINIQVDYVNITANGHIDYNHLEALLEQDIPTLVTLMHVNNETGVILDLERVGQLCIKHQALFHSDTVQSIGKYRFDLASLPVHFITASAHKFHGPKGVGFIYINSKTAIIKMLHGGEQEKGLRPGTEPLHQVAGMAKALDMAYTLLDKTGKYITSVREYLLEQLDLHFEGYKINGSSTKTGADDIFYTLLNIQLPVPAEKTAMILFHLDMKGIAVSRGSACQSGSVRPSHVLKEFLPEDELKKPSIRVSLSVYNTKEDIDILISALKTI